MINENNELIINTSEGFELTRIIKKINMKETIKETLKYVMDANIKNQNLLEELRESLIKELGTDVYNNLDEIEKKDKVDKYLNNHTDFKKRMTDAQRDLQVATGEKVMDLIYTFVENIPLAEKEVNKALSNIFNKKINDIEKQGLDETVEMIMKIVQCETFKSFFKFATK